MAVDIWICHSSTGVILLNLNGWNPCISQPGKTKSICIGMWGHKEAEQWKLSVLKRCEEEKIWFNKKKRKEVKKVFQKVNLLLNSHRQFHLIWD